MCTWYLVVSRSLKKGKNGKYFSCTDRETIREIICGLL